MRKLFAVLAAVLLLATPLRAQDSALIGTWAASGYANDNARGIQVKVVAVIRFGADSTYQSVMATDDGSGEIGSTGYAGRWGTAKDAWGSEMLCVTDRTGLGHCQPYTLKQGSLSWGPMSFQPVDPALLDQMTGKPVVPENEGPEAPAATNPNETRS